MERRGLINREWFPRGQRYQGRRWATDINAMPQNTFADIVTISIPHDIYNDYPDQLKALWIAFSCGGARDDYFRDFQFHRQQYDYLCQWLAIGARLNRICQVVK